MVLVLKTNVARVTVGSNPTPSENVESIVFRDPQYFDDFRTKKLNEKRFEIEQKKFSI